MWADQALARFELALKPASIVLDIGSGAGVHTRIFESWGHRVVQCDLGAGCNFLTARLPEGYFPAVWCSHVLEHMPDTNVFLDKVHRCLAPGGLLAITVPPLKEQIVGGHVSLWNAGLLLYRLVLAGFDCSEARVGTYGYNCSVLVREKAINDPPALLMDQGDIGRLARYFPEGINADGFDGSDLNINW